MKLLINTILLFFFTLTIHAQNTLSGKVKDKNGQPIVGATVFIKSLKKGGTTNFEGNFSIKDIKVNRYSIVFQSVGFISLVKEVEVNNSETTIEIILLESTNVLDEVVVSAGRTTEKISEVPASITILNQNQLQLLNQSSTNMSELLEFAVPGLAPSTGTYSNWGQTLRGRNLMVMVDGVPQSTPLRNAKVGLKAININDIARIEVIKGATAIYGNGGDGGIVNYITKKPSKSSKLSGTTNIWNTSSGVKNVKGLGIGVSQSLTGTINDFSYYVSGSFEKIGDKYDANHDVLLPTYSLGNTNIYSGLTNLGYQINENQKISLRATHYQSRQNSPFVATLGEIKVLNKEGDYIIKPGMGVLPTVDNPKLGSDTGATSTSGQFKYQIKNLFNQTTSIDTDVFYQKAKNIFFYSTKFIGGGQSVVNSEKFGIRPNFHTVLRFKSPLKLSLTYGVDILKDKTNQGLLDGRLWVPNLNLFSYAPYLQSKLKYNNTWVFKAGLRYDDMNLDIKDFSTLAYDGKGNGNFNPSVAIKGDDLAFKSTSINLGVRYIKNDDFIPYISYSQGFSLPDIGGTIRGAKAKSIEDIDLKAVKTNNYELGFISKFKHIKFEAVGFYSTSNLGLGLMFNDKNNRFEATKNPQKIFGAEVSTDFRYLQDKLQFGASYSFVEGLKHLVNNPQDLSYIGGDVISAPKLTGYISIKPLKKLRTSFRITRIGERNRFKAKEKSGNFFYSYREAPVKGYTLVNFSTDYDLRSNIKLSFAVNNLLNNFYLPARAQWAAPLRSQTTAGEGINLKLGLTFNF